MKMKLEGINMQRYILSKQNSITLISAILIALAFFGRFSLDNMAIFNWSLIIASIDGLAPIAPQAHQAVKVKVVSIDVLAPIAVSGAAMIQEHEESVIVTFLFLNGSYLEQRTLNKARSAIKEFSDLAP